MPFVDTDAPDFDGYLRLHDSWTGRGPHDGHTVTAIEQWPARVDLLPDGEMSLTTGRVRCSCGVEWNACGVHPPVEP